MAPEVIQGFDYDYSADLWSLGIMTYELIVGQVPFGESEEDPVRVYTLILDN
jgi:serine/threonine protein kinase